MNDENTEEEREVRVAHGWAWQLVCTQQCTSLQAALHRARKVSGGVAAVWKFK